MTSNAETRRRLVVIGEEVEEWIAGLVVMASALDDQIRLAARIRVESNVTAIRLENINEGASSQLASAHTLMSRVLELQGQAFPVLHQLPRSIDEWTSTLRAAGELIDSYLEQTSG